MIKVTLTIAVTVTNMLTVTVGVSVTSVTVGARVTSTIIVTIDEKIVPCNKHCNENALTISCSRDGSY